MNARTCDRALCILSRFLNPIWMTFLEKFSDTYDIYMVVDDNTIAHDDLTLAGIHVVQIPDDECRSHNYYNSSVASNLKDIVAWDKALYYFNRVLPSREGMQYTHIWFLEDDVFLWDEACLHKMDADHPTSDLLTAFHEVNPTGDMWHGWNHWVNVIHRVGTPWAHSLVCACRVSRRVLEAVDAYVSDRPLLFIEALLNTLAIHYGYVVDTPAALGGITYDGKWSESDLTSDKTRLYHPVKDMELHARLRGSLSPN